MNLKHLIPHELTDGLHPLRDALYGIALIAVGMAIVVMAYAGVVYTIHALHVPTLSVIIHHN
jgi:hypothetical protein